MKVRERGSRRSDLLFDETCDFESVIELGEVSQTSSQVEDA